MAERNEIKDIVDALQLVKIAIESLNPDPAQTIQQHRRRQCINLGLGIYASIVATCVAAVEIFSFFSK